MLTEGLIASVCVESSAELNRMCQIEILDQFYYPAHLWPYAIPPFIMGHLQFHVENFLMGPCLHKQGQFLLSI